MTEESDLSYQQSWITSKHIFSITSHFIPGNNKHYDQRVYLENFRHSTIRHDTLYIWQLCFNAAEGLARATLFQGGCIKNGLLVVGLCSLKTKRWPGAGLVGRLVALVVPWPWVALGLVLWPWWCPGGPADAWPWTPSLAPQGHQLPPCRRARCGPELRAAASAGPPSALTFNPRAAARAPRDPWEFWISWSVSWSRIRPAGCLARPTDQASSQVCGRTAGFWTCIAS